MSVIEKDVKRMSELLDRFRSELMALKDEAVHPPKVPRARVVELTRILLASFAKVDAQLSEELSPARAAQRRQQAQRMQDRALTYFAADLERERSLGGERTRRAELAAIVAQHDQYLLKWAWPLFSDDKETADVLADISRGTGHQDDAEDVLRLVKLYRSQWHLADGQTPVTRARLDAAEADATEMVTLLSSDTPNRVRDLAWRAYTAWRQDYVDLMALGRYLMRHMDNVDLMFPGIFAARVPSTPQSSDQAAEEDAPDDTDNDTDGDDADSTEEDANSSAGGI